MPGSVAAADAVIRPSDATSFAAVSRVTVTAPSVPSAIVNVRIARPVAPDCSTRMTFARPSASRSTPEAKIGCTEASSAKAAKAASRLLSFVASTTPS